MFRDIESIEKLQDLYPLLSGRSGVRVTSRTRWKPSVFARNIVYSMQTLAVLFMPGKPANFGASLVKRSRTIQVFHNKTGLITGERRKEKEHKREIRLTEMNLN